MKSLFSNYALLGLLAAGPLAGASYFVLKRSPQPPATTAKAKKVKPLVDSAAQSLDHYRKKVVHQALAEHQDEFELCYNQYLRLTENEPDREPSSKAAAQGSLTLNWLINSEGHPTEIHIAESQISSSSLQDCVISAVQKIELTPPPNQVPLMIAHRFKFKMRLPEKIEF